MSSLTEGLEKQDEADRFAEYVLKENPNIKSREDIEEALSRAFSQGNGQHAIFDNDDIRKILESNLIQNAIINNTSEEKFEEIEQEVQTGTFETQRDGKNVIVFTPKKVTARSYTRAGKSIKSYNRGFQKWSPSEIKFLKARKMRKISPKKVIYEFNQNFKESQRSSSSIKSKLYRT